MLKLACDRKVRFYSTHENSYGINAGPPELGGTCPGCTRGPGGCFHIPAGKKNPTCYAYCLAKCFKCAGSTLDSNTRLLGGTQSDIRRELVETMESFVRKTEDWCRKHGKQKKDYMYFRLHWSGDVFSVEYAKALVSAMRKFKDITFWTYTRSFEYVDILKKAENLILYISADHDNWKEAVRCFEKNRLYESPRFKIAYMGKELEDFANKVEDIARSNKSRMMVKLVRSHGITCCPVDLGRLGLEGGCSKCRQCISYGNPLLFFKC